MRGETWWAAPAQGFSAALLVAGPLGEFTWAWLYFSASALILLGVELLFRRRTGLSVSRPAGRRGRTLLIVLGVILAGALGVNIWLEALGMSAWIFIVAAAAGLITALFVLAYDRAFAAEVPRAR